MMKSVRLRRLQNSFQGLINPQLRDDLPGTLGCYGALAFLESESGSEYEVSKLPPDGRSVSWGRRSSTNKTIPGNSDVGKYREDQVGTLQSATELPQLLKGEEKSKSLAKALQHPDSQSITLTTADVCKVLQGQIDPAQAWEFFIWAGKQKGFKHTTETCSQMVLSFCKYEKKLNAVPYLLEFMRQCDLPLTTFFISKIIQRLARSGQYQEAVKIFKAVMASGYRAHTVLYNQYLDVLVKAGYYDQIDAGYVEMQQHGLLPDVYTYSILINGFGKANKIQQAWDTYAEMKANGYPPDKIICMSLVCVLKQAGKTEKALQVIDETLKSRIAASTLLKLLTGGNTSKDVKRWALDLAEQTPKGDFDPPASCDEFLLSLLSNTEDLDSVVCSLHDMLSQGQMPSTTVCKLVLLSAGEAGKADMALELIRHLKTEGYVLDELSYNATIGALLKASKVEEALQLTKEMQDEGHVASRETCKKLIFRLHKAGQYNCVFKFLSQLQNFEPDTSTSITLMTALCKLDDPSLALQCLKEAGVTSESLSTRAQGGLSLIHRSKDPKLSSYMLFLSNLCWNRRAEDTCDLLEYMGTNGMLPQMRKYRKFMDGRAYNTMLLLLDSQGQVEKAWRLFQQLTDVSSPERYTYASMMKILGRAGHFQRVYQVLKEMKSRGFSPDVYTYTRLMTDLGRDGRLNEIEELLEIMERDGCVPTAVTYSVILTAFAKAGQVDKAYSFFEQGIDNGCIPDVASYNAILRGYFLVNRVFEAVELYNVMLAMGCKSNAATYSIMFEGLSKAGLSDLASDVIVNKENVELVSRPLQTEKIKGRFPAPLVPLTS